MEHYRLPQLHWLTFLLFFSLFSACSAQEPHQKPDIKLINVSLVRAYQNAIDLEAELEIYNPNSRSGRVVGFQYQLDLEGHKMAGGETRQPFTVPARKSVRVPIPATLYYNDVAALFPVGLLKRNLNYVVKGTVFLEVVFWKHPVPFTHEGTINFSEMVTEQIRGLIQGL